MKERKNLTVQTHAFVTKVLFDTSGDVPRATGVEYTRGVGRAARERTVSAGEVILCGGAINTPQLLQLSGIGDRELLAQHDIPLVQHLPGVGENLQDHLEVYIQYASKQPVSIAPGLAWHQRPKIGFQWLFQRKGLGATNHFEGGGFCRSNEDVDWPNLMFHFLPIAIRYDDTSPIKGHGYQVHIGPMYADTRGWVRIKSKDPKVHPAMQFNYLSTPTDRKEWVEAVRVARTILNQPAFAPSTAGRSRPARRWRPTRRSSSGCGRTRDRAPPVVHRSDGHRSDGGHRPAVAEGRTAPRACGSATPASSPTSPTADIYAPVMMVAEKAVDLILGNTPLPLSDAPYYRHRDDSPLDPADLASPRVATDGPVEAAVTVVSKGGGHEGRTQLRAAE